MIDWISLGTMITAAVTATGVIIALVALISEVINTKRSLQTSALLALDEKLHSKSIKYLRIIASSKILHKDLDNDEFGELLEYLGTICMLINNKAIDITIAYKNFSWWIVRYWLSGRYYIDHTRLFDKNSWKTMEDVVKLLLIKEGKEGYQEIDYSEEKLVEFLIEETKLYVQEDIEVIKKKIRTIRKKRK